MSVYIPPSAYVGAILGNVAHRATATVAADQDLFSTSGAVLLTGLLGRVTTAIGAGSQDLEIDFDPDDGGANVALSTLVLVDAAPTGTLFHLNATAGGALVNALDVAYNGILAAPIVLGQAGDIVLDVTGTEAGSVEWWAWWLPIDDGASLVAT